MLREVLTLLVIGLIIEVIVSLLMTMIGELFYELKRLCLKSRALTWITSVPPAVAGGCAVLFAWWSLNLFLSSETRDEGRSVGDAQIQVSHKRHKCDSLRK